jgi:outer membrane lipoprotein carrier protein
MRALYCLLLILPLTVQAASLESRLSSTQSFSGAFEQQLLSESGEVLQVSSGTFALQQPGKFRWHILTPDEQLLLVVDDDLLHYDVELETATLSPIDDAAMQSPLAILGGEGQRLRELYHIEQSSPNSYTLRPIAENGPVTQITIEFSGNTPTVMSISDKLRQLSRITLSAVELNPDLPETTFEFTVPDGVDYFRNDD